MSAVVSPLHADLDFNCPLSDERAARIVASLHPLVGARVVDLGCGWAELLLRVVASDPTVTGVGVDTDGAAIGHGRANATARHLSPRVELRVADAAGWAGEPADVLLCMGSSHIWGGTASALVALRSLLRPGGRLVFGECFWSRPPTDAALAALAAEPGTYGDLADLVELAVAHGYRPLAVAEATTDEWDSFESRFALAWERALLARPDAPDADETRARADAHRDGWLRGYRGVLGFAYLTLGIGADSVRARSTTTGDG